MPTIEQIRRVTVRGESQGVDKLAQDLNSLSAAQTKVASSSEAMNSVTKSSTGTIISAQREFDRYSRSIDPVAKAHAALAAEMRLPMVEVFEVASFYHHFDGMAAFLDELARFYGADQVVAILAGIETEDPVERLRNADRGGYRRINVVRGLRRGVMVPMLRIAHLG